MEPARLGEVLRRALGERAVGACLGASAITAVPAAAAVRAMPVPCPPAAAPIWLWCAGRDVEVAALRRALGDEAIAAAAELGLVAIEDDHARATATLAPLGAGLVAGDRHDAAGADRVPWPDDSTLHLWHCLPRRLGAWLDVGTGAAALPIAAGARADRVRATDVAARSIERARLGLALAGRADVDLAPADLLDGAGAGWDVISFNAPIPGERAGGAPETGWHRAPAGAALIERFWRDAVRAVAPGGEVIVHGAVGAPGERGAAEVAATAGGSVVVARYTPRDAAGFAITRWQPGGPAGWVEREIVLAPGRPFVTRADLDAGS